MTALTMKERASVNAALATIHASGHDVTPVQQQARAAMAQGKPAYAAYKVALTGFAKANPDVARVLVHTDRLIEASDSATVARYDTALAEYIRTGDERHVNALEGMFRADSVALAVKAGTVSAEDAAAGRVDWGSMGLNAPATAGAPARFSFANSGTAPPPAASPVPQPNSAPAAPRSVQSGIATVRAAGGGIAERRARLEALPSPGASRPSPYAGMAPAQIKDAMRADMAGRTGWQREPTEG